MTGVITPHGPPALSRKEKSAVKLFLGRFSADNASTATEMTLLYGLAALLSTHGLKHISQLDDLDFITCNERKWVAAALATEPVGRSHYWNGKEIPWAKGPGPVTGTIRQNHGRKNVIGKYPFADNKASCERLIRRGLRSPATIPQAPTYVAMNDFGVPPLFSLNAKTRSNVTQKTFQEYNFSARGMAKQDVEEALKYAGCISEQHGGRVRYSLDAIQTGGRDFFPFEAFLDIVERFVELELEDKEEEQDEFFEAPPELPLEEEEEEEEEAPQPVVDRKRQVVGKNIIPWDGKGTTRTVVDKNGVSNYKNTMRTTGETAALERARQVTNAKKSVAQRWAVDRDFAKNKADKVRVRKEGAQALYQQAGFHGRTQMGAAPTGSRSKLAWHTKEGKDGYELRSKQLKAAIKKGRTSKSVNSSEGGNVTNLTESTASGRSTPIRGEWVTRGERRRLEVGGAVELAERFLEGEIAQGLEDVSSDGGSFQRKLGDITDPSLEGRVEQERRGQRRSDSKANSKRPPLAGWVGDYSASANDMFKSSMEAPKVGGWRGEESYSSSGAGGESSRVSSGVSSGGEKSWDFEKIVEKGEGVSGSELRFSSSSAGGGGESSGVESSREGGIDLGGESTSISNVSRVVEESGGSSVASSDIYMKDVLGGSPGSSGGSGGGEEGVSEQSSPGENL